MPETSRPSSRQKATTIPMRHESLGVSVTKRNSVTTSGASITLPAKISRAMFQNTGTFDIRIRINASGPNFWTLKPGEKTPFILVSGSTLDVMAVTGDSTLECIFEG